ncbi:GTP-binding chloroplastic [Micractinium conductrix]|uniref:GTP-binding chloroplastic n=1 Tax=Micractinium conductrix TaxID=554055 RepID=A0A2P6VBN2_9CHLO|nr:GTP-binding chloroplastic [Micractinium conductrix]|eukprot:PSC71478.1 GTP-binding chloroplastic [Micractinium conductrix]
MRGKRTQQATAPPEEFPELALGSEAFEDEEWAPGAGSDDDDGPAAVWVTHEQEEAALAAAEAAVVSGGTAEYGEGEGDEEKTPVAGKRLPAEVRCFDTARIYAKGGDGGRGCVAFRREKYVPRGGPSGGNGGHGGSVYLEVDPALNSLMTFRRQVHFRADPGTPGQGSDMHGANAKDLLVKVPPGTIVRARGDDDEAEPLAELLRPGDRFLVAPGGRGGRGNLAFKSARNTAPALAEFGEKGQEVWIDLELKLVADVGIIGCPNAGKSTLLSVVSAAKPKIANYPFTTLVPNLGVCNLDYRTTVFADVPGLLEGAHVGVGLGHQFLRHCQRCRLLVHVVDGTSPDPMGDFRAIRQELELFNPELAVKPQMVAYNKMDVPDSSDYWEDIKEQLVAEGVPAGDIYAISAVSGRGVTELVRAVRAMLDTLPEVDLTAALEAEDERREQRGAVPSAPLPGRRDTDKRIGEFSVESDLSGPRVWFVRGTAIERFAQMTDWGYYEAARRFQRVLVASGIDSALRAKGVLDGDTVVIGDLEFEYSSDKSESTMYDRWFKERRAAGIVGRGQARWPHVTG